MPHRGAEVGVNETVPDSEKDSLFQKTWLISWSLNCKAYHCSIMHACHDMTHDGAQQDGVQSADQCS